MSDRDGGETLIRETKKPLGMPVNMLTFKTENEFTANTLKAFTAGAQDCLTNLESLFSPSKSAAADTADSENAPASHRVDILVIAVPSGGSDALFEILPRLEPDFPVPVLIVQHLPQEFTSLLAARLNAQCRIAVTEARSGDTLHAGKAWLAPGGRHLSLCSDGGHIRLVTTWDPPEHSCRPASDVLFRSAAKFYGRHTLALVLSGMGQDGIAGCHEIRNAGGSILVQVESAAAASGFSVTPVSPQPEDQGVPLNAIANVITQRVREKRSNARSPITAS